MRLFRKTDQEPLLNPEVAGQLLHNVFEACGCEQNTVPLDALMSYSNYRKERYLLQRALILGMLLLFMFLPALFITAKLVITVTMDDRNPTYNVSVASGRLVDIPIRQILAKVDGRNVPIYEVSDNEYIIQPGLNGIMTVSVTLVNRQNTVADVEVTDVDVTSPVVVSMDQREDGIILIFNDEGSGVDFKNIAVTDQEGRTIGFTMDPENSELMIPYPENILELAVPDMRGNTLNIRLKAQ